MSEQNLVIGLLVSGCAACPQCETRAGMDKYSLFDPETGESYEEWLECRKCGCIEMTYMKPDRPDKAAAGFEA